MIDNSWKEREKDLKSSKKNKSKTDDKKTYNYNCVNSCSNTTSVHDAREKFLRNETIRCALNGQICINKCEHFQEREQ